MPNICIALYTNLAAYKNIACLILPVTPAYKDIACLNQPVTMFWPDYNSSTCLILPSFTLQNNSAIRTFKAAYTFASRRAAYFFARVDAHRPSA